VLVLVRLGRLLGARRERAGPRRPTAQPLAGGTPPLQAPAAQRPALGRRGRRPLRSRRIARGVVSKLTGSARKRPPWVKVANAACQFAPNADPPWPV